MQVKQGDASTHLLECLKLKKASPVADENSEQEELSYLVGTQNGTFTLEDGLSLKKNKTQHSLTIRPSKHSPGYLPDFKT